ncbi:alpha/beta fold hydrolase [Natronobacterium gregoryi]|uniref:Alpha/beta hydrolase n=2 Tax=Natronobacterium gregoryi TaxID=44930 RepID=L0AEK6_NATGS|nr:alpha/beta hydrolase [Natronobacterium gregoryi]AFZ71495.1 putative hydrolase or acyltransferase of alpha/beta superfamily [Natronobacterium gregoryi SP2]ELY66798.1 alpha/beta hydrolase fold protein [Natronobacterium gregoryi SP2]PLK18700.1 alpha/beta hydrolase [Natronobacterium gregoryi SP2]SFJ68043.1 Pimeloyl-ACP methyl ester carboxylesterase [Natronobacterium gregoryi]
MDRPTAVSTEIRGVDVVGPPDARSIVFVHGAMVTRKMWGPQRDALADDYRVVAPDLPGHGNRADESFELEYALTVLDDVVDELADGNAILVGLSLGGYVITEYASRYPNKVDGLVIVGSSANPVRGMNLLTRLTGGVARLATRSDLVERAVERLGERWVRNRDLDPEHEREILESGIFPREFGTPGPDLAGRDVRATLRAYHGPVLVVNGERDEIMRRGERDHAAAADADVVVLEGVGHVCTLHRPETFTNLVEQFVRRVDASA